MYLTHFTPLDRYLRIILIVLVLQSWLSSCKREKNIAQLSTINIEQSIETTKSLLLSEIADSICFIPLETSDDCMLGSINGICIKDSLIALVDQQNKIYLFDINGRFIRTIGHVGHGPNEYVHPICMKISNDLDKLFLYDGGEGKMLIYDLKTGECKRRKRIEFIPSCFTVMDDGNLAFYCCAASFQYSKNKSHVVLMNSKLEVVNELCPACGEESKLYGFSTIYNYPDEVHFWNSKCDTVYSLDNSNAIKPSLVFDYGKYDKASPVDVNAGTVKGKQDFFIDNVIETKQYLFLRGIFDGRYGRNIWYNKATGENYNVVFNYDIYDMGFHNDLDGGIPFWPAGQIDESHLYTYISPYRLKKVIDSSYAKSIKVQYEDKRDKLYEYVHNCTLETNPIIFIAKLRQ